MNDVERCIAEWADRVADQVKANSVLAGQCVALESQLTTLRHRCEALEGALKSKKQERDSLSDLVLSERAVKRQIENVIVAVMEAVGYTGGRIMEDWSTELPKAVQTLGQRCEALEAATLLQNKRYNELEDSRHDVVLERDRVQAQHGRHVTEASKAFRYLSEKIDGLNVRLTEATQRCEALEGALRQVWEETAKLVEGMAPIQHGHVFFAQRTMCKKIAEALREKAIQPPAPPATKEEAHGMDK